MKQFSLKLGMVMDIWELQKGILVNINSMNIRSF